MKSTPTCPLHTGWLLQLTRRLPLPHKLGICRRLFGRRLARHGVAWVRTAAGPVWKLDLTNATHQWLVYGDYEGPGFWRWLQPRAATIRTVIDSGANIGQTVLSFAARLPTARIYAYEPGSAARSWLTESVQANALSKVMISAAALGAARGETRLAAIGDDNLHGSWNQIHADRGEPVPLVTLDEELTRHGIARLDLWKLDMEGYEGAALEGAEKALQGQRIRAIYMETSGASGLVNAKYLERLGYRVHSLTPNGRLQPWVQRIPCENVLCLAEEPTGD